MTVKELKEELEKYREDAIVMFVDDLGERYTAIVGSDEDEEGYLGNDGDDGDTYCSITVIW